MERKKFQHKTLEFVTPNVCACISHSVLSKRLMNEVINDDYDDDDARLAVSAHNSFSFEALDLLTQFTF